LHPEALAALTTARDRVRRLDRRFTKDVAREALAALEHARSALVGE
jgi:hypothetical protein